MSQSEGPKLPAVGENGRWVLLGSTSVDSASMAVVDLGTFQGPQSMTEIDPDGTGFGGEFSGNGVGFWCGLGDGEYEVWGWVVDYGDDTGERVAAISVTLVDEKAIAEWREHEWGAPN